MNRIKILYVDSDRNYSQRLLSYLLEKNYDIKYIKSLKDALIESSFFKPNILITDIELEDGDGLNLISKIKKYQKDINTVLLASEVNEQILLSIIPAKLDRFILKKQSFDFIESEISKIELKEDDSLLDEEYDLGEDFIYKNNCLYTPDEKILKLTMQESSLLKILVQAKGEYVSYDILQHSLSKTNYTSLETIRTVIKKIRKKTFTNIIKNHSGLGYKTNYYHINKDIEDLSLNSEKLNIKILVLKGDTRTNSLLCYELKKYGMSCDSVFTIAQAKDLLDLKKYDYIISDLNLPDGEMIDFIRDFEELITTKMIILSSNKDIHYKDYLYFKGILDYIINNNDIVLLSSHIYRTILKVQKNVIYSKLIYELIEQRELMRNYKIIVEQSSIISKTNVKGEITYVNKNFCDISGYNAKELIGNSHNIIRHPDERDNLFKDLWNTIKNKKQIWTGVLKNRTKEGEDYYVQSSIMPILNKDKEVIEFIALRTDISNVYSRK